MYQVCKTLLMHKSIYSMFMNASKTAILVKFHKRLAVIMDCLALSTMYLDEYKAKQSMKFAGTIG